MRNELCRENICLYLTQTSTVMWDLLWKWLTQVASFRLVSQIIPVDSILHFWLKNGLTGSTTNDIEMSPDIWNLNTLGFVIIVIINGLGSWEDTTSMLVVSLIKHHKTKLAEKCIFNKSAHTAPRYLFLWKRCTVFKMI